MNLTCISIKKIIWKIVPLNTILQMHVLNRIYSKDKQNYKEILNF